MLSTVEKIKYFLWAGVHYPFAETSCPACGNADTERIIRKALVTTLYQCRGCGLRFRFPKDTLKRSDEFYQHAYQQAVTTDCPQPRELERLIATGFKDSGRDFAGYIDVIRGQGLKPNAVILDYGSSWGYGSWQLKQAGYRVYSFEISAPRAQYGREHLDCRTLDSPESCPEKVDLFFSAHVIEHLPNPNLLWEAARQTLKPDGLVILFMPNGDPAREQMNPSSYHQVWGKVHPLLLTATALNAMAQAHGFVGRAFSAPFDLAAIGSDAPGDLAGDELLYIARKVG
jgi:2-polyprenyl-3-methyl-5-hydroxy-6-metoxy-1,4-benzoquinol methylase